VKFVSPIIPPASITSERIKEPAVFRDLQTQQIREAVIRVYDMMPNLMKGAVRRAQHRLMHFDRRVIFPAILILCSVGSAISCFADGDWRRGLYWTASSICIASVPPRTGSPGGAL
jgi:hypothetical protein